MATLENWRVTKWKMRRYVLSWGWVGRGAFKECKLIWCGHVGFTGSNYHGEKKVLVPTVGPRVVMDGESPPHGLLEPPYPKVASIIQLFVYLFILRKIRELLTGDMICGGRTRGPLSWLIWQFYYIFTDDDLTKLLYISRENL